jgi:hypothetical protein
VSFGLCRICGAGLAATADLTNADDEVTWIDDCPRCGLIVLPPETSLENVNATEKEKQALSARLGARFAETGRRSRVLPEEVGTFRVLSVEVGPRE